MKVFGGICILAGAVGFGQSLNYRMHMHLKQLQECREIFTGTDTEREYLRLPYAKLLRRTAKGRSEIMGNILIKIAEEMERNTQSDIGVLWENAFGEAEKKGQIFLDNQEQEIVIALAKSLRLEGEHERVAKLYFERLDERILQALEEKKEKQKLYRSISVLMGIFLVIILL